MRFLILIMFLITIKAYSPGATETVSHELSLFIVFYALVLDIAQAISWFIK